MANELLVDKGTFVSQLVEADFDLPFDRLYCQPGNAPEDP